MMLKKLIGVFFMKHKKMKYLSENSKCCHNKTGLYSLIGCKACGPLNVLKKGPEIDR
jgi:hypothetical protein